MTDMNLALLVLRVVLGLLFVGHGAQKLFGVFGGGGLKATAETFEAMHLRPGRVHALVAGAAEVAGGALLALGLVTPVAAALLIAVMTAAVVTVHLPNGLWGADGGYEYNLVMAAGAFALAGLGPGAWSLDHAIGVHWASTGWALAALGAGLAGGLGAVIAGRAGAAPERRAGRAHPA
jgi:putative oxidoreductase